MTINEFNLLDDIKKAEEVHCIGVHVADRAKDFYKIMLYQLPQFYVEVWYEDEANEIAKFKAFTDLYQLSPYTRDIDISSLFDN